MIRSLDANKPHGHDDVSIRMIKICDNSLIRPSSLLFKKFFDNSYFPELWKKWNVIPIHQKKITNKILKIIAPFHYSLFSVKYLRKRYLIKCTLFSSKLTTLKSKSIWFPSIRFMHKPITLNQTRNFPVFPRYTVTQNYISFFIKGLYQRILSKFGMKGYFTSYILLESQANFMN